MKNGCPCDEDTCALSAKHGHLECLKYAHEDGCTWDEDTCKNADENGHLECLNVLMKTVVHETMIHVIKRVKMVM